MQNIGCLQSREMSLYVEHTLLVCTTDPQRQGKVRGSCPHAGEALFAEHRQKGETRQGCQEAARYQSPPLAAR